MATYRRIWLPGASYFFTINLAERNSRTLTERIELLRTAFRYSRSRHPFTIDAIVVLPDHLHTIFSLPEGDADYATRIRLIKTVFSRNLPKFENRSASRLSKRERGIWQRRYYEHTLRDDQDYARHVDYIHFNPVKHGHVDRVRDWPYSSFHRFVRQRIYPIDWAGGLEDDQGRSGEV